MVMVVVVFSFSPEEAEEVYKDAASSWYVLHTGWGWRWWSSGEEWPWQIPSYKKSFSQKDVVQILAWDPSQKEPIGKTTALLCAY